MGFLYAYPSFMLLSLGLFFFSFMVDIPPNSMDTILLDLE